MNPNFTKQDTEL